MKLVFFDESKNDADYPCYHLGGVCIDEAHLGMIESKVAELSQQAFGTSELRPETEFHAAEIYHRRKNFKGWTDFDARIELIGSFAEILSLPEVKRIDIEINCALLNRGQAAEDIAFMFFCERANGLVRGQKSLGMLIGDRESDRHSAWYAMTLSGYRAKGTDFAFGRDIHNLVDSAHFTHSHLSRFLQLADVYVWLLQFHNRNRGSENGRHRALFKRLSSDDINLFPSTYKHWPKAA